MTLNRMMTQRFGTVSIFVKGTLSLATGSLVALVLPNRKPARMDNAPKKTKESRQSVYVPSR